MQHTGLSKAFRAGIVALLAALLTISAGCGGRDEGTTRLLEETAVRTASLRTFEFRLEIIGEPIAGSGLPLTSANGAVVVPDKLRAEVGGYYAEIPQLDPDNPRHTAHIVAIGNRVWRTELLVGSSPIGAWSLVTADTTPLAHFDPSAGVLDLVRSVRQAKATGSHYVVDGTPVRRVTGSVPAVDVARLVGAASPQGRVDVTLWIDDEDKLVRRVDVLGRVGQGEDIDTARTFWLSHADQPVTIESPVPTPRSARPSDA